MVVAALADLDLSLRHQSLIDVDLGAALQQAVGQAAARLTEAANANPELRGAGTTVIAMLLDGLRAAILHIGDSRVYMLREHELSRLTRDHTLVQALVDDGRISVEEAVDHPRRSVLIRTLQAGGHDEPELLEHWAELHDRYLLCSDGVTAVLSDAQVRDVLVELADPDEVVDRLIAMANAGGGPDNITCVVADVVDDAALVSAEPVIVGAAHHL